MNLSASAHEHRIRGVGRGRGDRVGQRQTGWVGPALAIIVPTAIVRPAVASAMLVLKLIATPATTPACGFSTSNIRNPNTRAAYAVAVRAARGGEEEIWRRAPPHTATIL
jgi:hypothetical protein